MNASFRRQDIVGHRDNRSLAAALKGIATTLLTAMLLLGSGLGCQSERLTPDRSEPSSVPFYDTTVVAVASGEVEDLRKSAEAGDTGAMVQLGELLTYGIGVTRDPIEAVRWYQKAADAGDAAGMFGLAEILDRGRGVPLDWEQAQLWYRRSADAGNPWAMLRLGSLSEHSRLGLGERDVQQSVDWSRKAAQTGDPVAMTALADRLEHGSGVAPDVPQAAEWYRKAAEAGLPVAMALLGDLLSRPPSDDKSQAEAIAWYDKASLSGDPVALIYAQNGVGRLLASRRASPPAEPDPVGPLPADRGDRVGPRSLESLRRSAEAGDPTAMVRLGAMLGSGGGSATDQAQATMWYRKAAEAGDPVGMNSLARMLQSGSGVAKDPAEAVQWYRKGASIGPGVIRTAAVQNLDSILYPYDPAAQTIELARVLRQRAEAGDTQAMVRLGEMLDNGEGVASNPAEAVTWYRKSAEAGNGWGMGRLGDSLASGRGVRRNDAEAVKWFQKAMATGDPQGQAIAESWLERLRFWHRGGL